MKATDLLSRVESTVQKYRMLVPGERLLVACSGGADSVTLFHLLRELAPRLEIRLSLVHFDHGLRPGSEKDLEFVRETARHFHVPFYGAKRKSQPRSFDKHLSPEEAAREARYYFFEQTAKKARIHKMALAHHRDDQAETVLMRMVQGTGLRGLQGIRPVIQRKGLTLIRPLFETSRLQIRGFLKRRSIAFREDPTNRSEKFLRNRIRRRLLPLLEREFNPQIRESLCRLAETAVGESTGFDDWVNENWRAYVHSRRKGTLRVRRDPFLLLPPALQFRLFDQILRRLDSRSGLDFNSWGRLAEGLKRGRYRATLPRKIDLSLTPKKLLMRKP